jgi:vacuolar-type H+-ATPase subunit E/Vma4
LCVASFADGQLTDAIRNLASDPGTDKRVKKKLLAVLASWRDQFKSDPSMTLVAGLYKQCQRGSSSLHSDVAALALNEEREKKREEKEEAKRRARQEKEEAKERARKEEERRLAERNRSQRTRAPFNFEKVHSMTLSRVWDTP